MLCALNCKFTTSGTLAAAELSKSAKREAFPFAIYNSSFYLVGALKTPFPLVK
jgi:hypothetical protein